MSRRKQRKERVKRRLLIRFLLRRVPLPALPTVVAAINAWAHEYAMERARAIMEQRDPRASEPARGMEG